MAFFPDAYYTAMDRSYAPIGPAYGTTPEGEIKELGLSPADIGISAPPFGDQLQALRAKIFQGAARVELGFMGRGKGSMQGGNTTPEMFGTDERRDMRELAKWNKVTLSVHATPNAGSLAGFSQNTFDDSVREATYNEIRRAVDFAADTTEGGPIVVHAQEFPRAILDQYPEFKAYPAESEKAVKHLVDERTGQIIPVRKNEFTFEPVYEEENGMWKTITGELIPKDFVPSPDHPEDFEKLFNRIPKWNPQTRGFDTVQRKWEHFDQRAKEINSKKKPEDRNMTPEELFYRSQIENRILQQKGASLFYSRQYDDAKDTYENAQRALEFYQKLEARTDLTEDERQALMIQRGFGQLIPPKSMKATEYLQSVVQRAKDDLRHIHEASAAADVGAAEMQLAIGRVKTIRDYATDKTSETLARAAIYAYDRERMKPGTARTGEKMQGPLYIAVENFFPEVYGGHPQEVADIIQKSRDRMTNDLVKERHISKSEAAKIAEDHIKATWDTGHANIWRKYFQEKPGESLEQTNERFKKWYLQQAEDLAKRKMIGNVHVSDNFGWEDEHVTPGQGIAPIKEFIETVKKHGVTNVIVEPAHQDVRAWRGGLKLFGGGVYGFQAPVRDTWADIEHSYFGRTAPPYFLYGDSAPDREAWSLWSGVMME